MKLYEVVKKDCYVQNVREEIYPHKRCRQFSYDKNMIIIEKEVWISGLWRDEQSL